MTFLKVIAWVVAVLSTIWWGLQLFWAITYTNSYEERQDKLKGYTKVYKPMKYFIIALVCWAFLIAF